MPVQYPTGILAEHLHTRAAAGLFDVSHMGQGFIEGPDHATSARALERLCPADILNLAAGRQRYTQFLNDQGGIIDDLMVTRSVGADGRLFLVVNAARKAVDFDLLRANLPADVRLTIFDAKALIALQGPEAANVLARLAPGENIEAMPFMSARAVRLLGADAHVSRSGYTGEDGFEIYFAPEYSEKLWDDLMSAGAPLGMIPAGLGARNTLRLEAGMCLYGHEIDETTTPWEAGLAWICKMEKAPFLGSDVLAAQKKDGVPRKLVGFEMLDKRIGRDGYPVEAAGKQVGRVTSGCPSPTLKKNIGMAYVPPSLTAVGTDLEIDIRAQKAAARVIPLPFYKRPQ
jgi:aminomethyltransferase